MSSNSQSQQLNREYFVFVGTYSPSDQQGIHVYRMDASGTLKRLHGISGVSNPSFLAVSPNQRYLYCVNETGNFQGQETGGVSAFAIDPETAELTFLNEQPSKGKGPCYVTVDQTNRYVLVANYGGGSVAMLPIEENGRLGQPCDHHQHEGSSVNERRQQGPHAHAFVIDPTNTYAYAPDLGIDKIMIYKLDHEHGKLIPNDPPFAAVKPGSGPRHFTFHPNGKLAYAIQELSSEITTFVFDQETGALNEIQTLSTLPEDFNGNNSCADIHISPNGMFLFGSNRGHNSLAIYSIEPTTGKLEFVGHESTRGETPRNFNIAPSGQFLLAANQNTDNIIPFELDQETGSLTPTGQEIEVSKPVCVKYMPI